MTQTMRIILTPGEMVTRAAGSLLALMLCLSCIKATVEFKPNQQAIDASVKASKAVNALGPTLAAQFEAMADDRVAKDSLFRLLMERGEPGAYEAWLLDRRQVEEVVKVRMAQPLYLMRDYRSLYVRGTIQDSAAAANGFFPAGRRRRFWLYVE